MDYLLHHEFPNGANKQLKGRITFKWRPYAICGDYLYHQRKDEVLQWALEKMDVSTILSEFHEGICEGHFVERITAKILQGGYNWPTLFKNAMEYCRTWWVPDICKQICGSHSFAPNSTIGSIWKMGYWLDGSSSYHPSSQQIFGGGNRLLHKMGQSKTFETSKK